MTVTTYFWDELTDNVIMESDDEGNVTTYTHVPELHGKVLSQNRNGVRSHFHYDGQGNVRQVTDSTGTVTDEATYTAFGETVSKTGSTVNPWGYKGALGYYTNPTTDDLYVRARTLEPSFGRWLSEDPIGIEGGVNLYVYVSNSPLNHVDPSGLLTQHLRDQLQDLGFRRIICDDSSKGNWFDRMTLLENSLGSFHVKGPPKGSLESAAGAVSTGRPETCGDNVFFVAAFEATGITMKGVAHESTGSQIADVTLHYVSRIFGEGINCRFKMNKPYRVRGRFDYGVSGIATCTTKCEKEGCAPSGFDAIIYAKRSGQYQTHPGQMLLWQARFCPKTSANCCVRSCDATTHVVQLEDGWNHNTQLDGDRTWVYTGPNWGRPSPDEKIGEEPRPIGAAVDTMVNSHKKNGGSVITNCS